MTTIDYNVTINVIVTIAANVMDIELTNGAVRQRFHPCALIPRNQWNFGDFTLVQKF